MASETFTFYVQPWYRKSPYFEATKRAGCKSWGLYNHMLLPTLYDDPVTEYWALLNDVTMWDVSVERCVEITGPDAFELTNLITCRDLTSCDVWQCKYVLLTAADGGIVNDPVLLRLGENHFWLALADSDALLYVAGVAAGRGMDVTIREADVAPMQVQGPRSKDVIGALFGDADARPPLLLVRRGRGRRHPGRRVPHRMDRRGRLRDLPARLEPRRRSVGARPAGRRTVRHPGDRAVGGPADRGGHLQLRQRHARRGHAVPRQRLGEVRRAGAGAGLHGEGGARAAGRGRCRPQARGHRHRRRPDDRRGRAERLLAGTGIGERAARSAGSPRPRGRRAWSATSGSLGCRLRI